MNGDRTTGPLRALTAALAILATAAIELAIAAPGASPAVALASAAAALVAPMLAASWWLGRRPAGPGRPAGFAALLVLLLVPLALHPLVARWTGRGVPLEVVLMAALRNLGLGLAALAHRPAFARLAALVSLFLVLVATAMVDGLGVLAVAGAYAVVGVPWLMLASWDGVAAAMVGGGPSRPPARAMAAWAATFGLVMVAAAAVGPTRAATVLAEWVASSGGTGATEPDARGGVNDGDNEVAANQDPRSIGFTDSEVYLESDRPSLYDSFSDMYGEPIKPKAKQERMVAMTPQENQAKDQPTENLQAGRTFATARRPPTRPPGAGAERPARALLYVKGATPLHLGLATYDHFDGAEWEEEGHCRQHCPLALAARAGAWLRVDAPTAGPAPAGGSLGHQIKIGALDSSTLPLPPRTARFRVGSVDRPEFFGWAQAGLIRMVGRTVPAGTVIDAESAPADPGLLRVLAFEPPARVDAGPYRDVPRALDPGVAALVGSWARGTARGWSQVEAVVAGVRGHCRHDRAAPTAEGGADAVGQFLLGSRCGPDYQFASATAVALRLLGYPCRVVSGYYADPARFDPKTRHTPVTAADVHFWVEVRVPGGAWAAVEPTPGYELLPPPPDLGARLAAAARRAGRWFRANLVAVALVGAALASALVGRHRLLDAAATLGWRLGARGPARARALGTLRLLELRSRRAGLRRPPGRTPARWYGSIAAGGAGESRAELERLVAIAGWAAHAPATSSRPPPWSERDIRRACRGAARTWTLDRFRERRRSLPTGEIMP